MSLIRSFSAFDDDVELAINNHLSWSEINSRVASFSDTASQSMFGMMGCGSIFQENNGIVKKYSEPEELLNDRFIPIRKASSLKMSCENPESENN